MQAEVIETIKMELYQTLKDFIQSQHGRLYVAANDNIPDDCPLIALEALDANPLSDTKLLFEIRIVLGLLGKAWQCEVLRKGFYQVLHPYTISLPDLVVIMMSLHIEPVTTPPVNTTFYQRAIMRYIVEKC